jgi:sulfate adenylyltransferase
MTLSTTSNVAPVHGGLARTVQRIEPRERVPFFAWRKLPQVEVSESSRTLLQRIADGTLSPLTGPMGRDDLEGVLERGAIERGGKSWAWTIPIVLPLTDEEAGRCEPGKEVALVHAGEVFGKLRVREVYPWDPLRVVRAVYGTDRTDHPGARLWTEEPRRQLAGGEITLVPWTDERPFAKRILAPAATRALIERRGWEQTIAFQTRNPLHRAHEYALVYGAETLLRRSGKRTGVVLNPLVGQLKGDDVPADVRMRTYEALIDGRFLGQGDLDQELWRTSGQDLNENLELIGLDIQMFYAGPREAVMHAIYRQNLGFSHFIVGRKHADAPYDDKTPIWGDFDAQKIFENLGGELSIRTVEVGFAAYFEEIARVGLVEENAGRTQVTISGTRMREMLGNGEMPDERVMRESTARVLADHYRSSGRSRG